nr:MAG TPA: holin [Caudoviricetes sp.]
MSNFEILVLIVGIVGGIVLASAVLIPLLKKKGVNTDQIIDSAQAGLLTADTILDGVQAALPGLPGIAIVDKVIELAQKSVGAAEQMKKSNQITPEQRKATAVQLVKDYLTAANVEITPDVEKIIAGAIEAAVFVLPKTVVAAT